MGASFDPAAATVGTPITIPEKVIVDPQGVLHLAVSADGTLVYIAPDSEAQPPMLGWVSRTGEFTEIASLPPGTDDAALSPDGTRALILNPVSSKVSIFDLARRVATPLNLDRRQVESASWYPDGKRITLGGAYLSLFDPDSGTETRLTPTGRPKRFASWNPDGSYAAYMTFEPGNDLYKVAFDRNAGRPASAPSPLVATPATENAPVIAPGGRWFSYLTRSDGSSGDRDVYIARFPAGTERVRVTSAGAVSAPLWSKKGDELFFAAPSGLFQRVPVSLGDRVQVGQPRTLFPLNGADSLSPAPDGSRFLAVKRPAVAPRREIVVVQHWLDELQALVPTR